MEHFTAIKYKTITSSIILAGSVIINKPLIEIMSSYGITRPHRLNQPWPEINCPIVQSPIYSRCELPTDYCIRWIPYKMHAIHNFAEIEFLWAERWQLVNLHHKAKYCINRVHIHSLHKCHITVLAYFYHTNDIKVVPQNILVNVSSTCKWTDRYMLYLDIASDVYKNPLIIVPFYNKSYTSHTFFLTLNWRFYRFSKLLVIEVHTLRAY